MSRPEVDALLPLSTPVLHVLLALGHGQLHGYAIVQAIEEKTDGVATILPGTLYATLHRMLEGGLIEGADSPHDAADEDRRRRYYRITELGREVMAAEAERMSVLVDLAHQNLKAT